MAEEKSTKPKVGWKIWVFGVVVLASTVYFGVNQTFEFTYATINGKDHEITSKNSVFDLGSEQQQYLREFIKKTKASIPDDATDARKKKIWINASKALCNSNKFNAFGLKKDWVGYVDTVQMRDSGRVRLEVQIDETDNEVQQIEIAKRFEDVALDLKEDDIVRISGKFKRGDLSENECLAGGLDSNPELYNEGFTFTFTNIEKIPTRTVERKREL